MPLETTIILVFFCFLAGFVDSIAGGGGLISLPTLLGLGLPPLNALGTNKLIGISTALSSSWRYWRAKKIERKTFYWAILAGLTGALGAFTVSLISVKYLRIIVILLLIAVALYTLFRPQLKSDNKKLKPGLALFFILLIGFYDGFFGPGTGVFLIVIHLLFLGKGMLGAATNSRLINLATNCGALIYFIYYGAVDLQLALPGMLASFLGGIIGAGFAIKYQAKIIKPIFILVTWGLIIKVVIDTFR